MLRRSIGVVLAATPGASGPKTDSDGADMMMPGMMGTETTRFDAMPLFASAHRMTDAYALAREQIAATRRATVITDGSSRLLHFESTGKAPAGHPPVLLVPSLINRWYVLDLCAGSSVVQALVAAGHDVWCIDWGCARAEDRHLTWDQVVERLMRFARVVMRRSGAGRLSMLGYCMGATVTAIGATFLGDKLHRLVNLAGPIDFSHSGVLGDLVDRRWFDADAIAAAGNVGAEQMQSGFVALDPSSVSRRWQAATAKLSAARDKSDSTRTADLEEKAQAGADDASFRRWVALDRWAADNIPFPAAAYATYIGALYQRNELAAGNHVVSLGRVDLDKVRCPVLTVVASRDAICPPLAAKALNFLVGSKQVAELEIPGGHVGAVVGRRAAAVLYPRLATFLGA